MTGSGSLAKARDWARRLKRNVVALWLAARDSRTPRLARVVAAMVAAYALSPIDLIPDFIPILGLLDDLVILPLGIMLAIRLIPPALMAELRLKAEQQAGRPRSRTAAVVILVLWIVAMLLAVKWLLPG